MRWFDVDRAGLAALLERDGRARALLELVSNALDTDARNIRVVLKPIDGSPACWVEVEDDDPEGFADLSHAWTLFAPSNRKGDVEKRGRFNLGEKLVLALCTEADIESASGTVRFDKDGRHRSAKVRGSGSLFTARMKLTRSDVIEARRLIRSMIIPRDVKLTLDGVQVPPRYPVATFDEQLPTEKADDDGNMKRTTRVGKVKVYDRDGDVAMLYEMGVPVVEIDGRFDVDVHQKVPLTMDRTNVTPGFLRALRVHVLNHTFGLLKPEDANDTWVKEGMADRRVSDDAVKAVLRGRYGERRVVYDPSDTEANARATAAGFTIIPGGALDKQTWANVRRAEGAQPSGKLFGTPQPFSDDPDAPQAERIPESDWSSAMTKLAAYTRYVGFEVLGFRPEVEFVAMPTRFTAAWSGRTLMWNSAHRKLPKAVNLITWDRVGTMIHEFAHHGADNHLSDEFYRNLTKLGLSLTQLALREPGLFTEVK